MFVYTMEAHATDEWPISGVNDHLSQHKTIEQRAAAAEFFRSQYPIDESIVFMLDNMGNDFNTLYSSWPTRYWIYEGGKVAMKMTPDHTDNTMSLVGLQKWLSDKYDHQL